MSTETTTWRHVKDSLGEQRLQLGPYYTYQFLHSPRRILHALSYHKFAARLIGVDRCILDVGCGEGLATLILAEKASQCTGVDSDAEAIAVATSTLGRERLQFTAADILTYSAPRADAITSFDVIEHISPEREDEFLLALCRNLSPDGMVIIGTPNISAAPYASPVTRAGHINLYSGERLRTLMERFFTTVLLFSANDEVVHTGFTPMAHYLIAVGIRPASGAATAVPLHVCRPTP